MMQAGSTDPRLLTEARLQAHSATQWLARITRSYIPAKPDDSHTSLTWSQNDQAMLTHYLPNNTAFGLVMSELVLFCVHPDGYSHEIHLDDKTDEEIGEWVEDQLAQTDLDPEELERELPYKIPHHPVQSGSPYDTIDSAIALQELGLWYSDAQKILFNVGRELSAKSLNVSMVRCWPHHFDMAFLIHLRSPSPDFTPIIGVGMSPGDNFYSEPYFYVTPWPYLKPVSLPELPFVGHWHVEGFVGAIALGTRIIEHDFRERVLVTFLKEAITVGQNRLVI